MGGAAPQVAWALAIERSAAGDFIRESAWIYPWSNIVHVVGVALLLGAVAVFDLRLLGVLRAARPADAAALALPVARLGFLLALPTGLVLFVAEANGVVTNPVFLVKFAAIAVGLANIAAFHLGPLRDVAAWTGIPPAARMVALLSLSAWLVAAVCGRWAAYV
ncbi:hypothetical protein EDC65_3870 [Stella humosa]|uniref:DUF6644 domain-containing protein n=1 Tax=Stella humosa TaxID=94 RepID=A0A3N1L226_9PROT|nr:DUF6644 family protein [Stella humosa]ROP84516.1 hypothetical protein EDC65_3870 [Stella humosa]BBK34036.1 hypothetical protein STHU_46700 [Stella humosa]